MILQPWAEHHLELLRRKNAPEMKTYLGGPETEEQLRRRHLRYLDLREGQMFAVLIDPGLREAGTVGYWQRSWQGETVYEAGWGVLPEFQGRGVAVAAVAALIDLLRQQGKHRYLHAFPKTQNAASNAVCRRAGFTLLGECDFEFPPGHVSVSNDWVFDLSSP